MTPKTRNRKWVENCEMSFNDKVHNQCRKDNTKRTNKHKIHNNIGNNENEGTVDEMAFVQVMHQVFVSSQMNLREGMKKFGDGAIDAMKKNWDKCI